MLKGIDPRVTPDLMDALMRMGHGDEIVIADANFPAHATAAHCNVPVPIHLPAMDAIAATELVCTLLPLDAFFDHCALRMQIDGAPDEMGEVHSQVFALLERTKPDGAVVSSLERQDFYVRARQAFAVVATSEGRPFGCFILRKGVIF